MAATCIEVACLIQFDEMSWRLFQLPLLETDGQIAPFRARRFGCVCRYFLNRRSLARH
jgi:hypothetical protein